VTPAAGPADRPDLRLLPGALGVWAGAAAAQALPPVPTVAGAVLLLVLGGVGGVAGRPHRGLAVALVLTAAALAVATLRVAGVQAGPVRSLAEEGAVVGATALVVTDPRVRPGPFGDFVLLRLLLLEVTGRGRTTAVRTPVLLFGEPSWSRVEHGQRVRVSGRLDIPDGADLAGVLYARGPPAGVTGPGPVGRAVNHLRQGLRDSARDLPPAERALVPALVNGDDTGMPEDVADAFRATGLTHLLAVSGANLTLVLAFVLTVGRWCGVRARGLLVLGALGVLGFVLLARTEPSVLRAAAMGVVALAGLAAGGRRRGMRALCVAVVVLVLLDPWLARSVGFALSVLATGGILVLAPAWRDAMARWMPRLLAEALAVPLSAQVVCTPVVAAISGQVSVVAVLANLLAAPAVAPATVLGVVATLLAPFSDLLAMVTAWLAGRPAWWIVTVAEQGARLPGAALGWPTSPAALAALTVLCLAVLAGLPAVLRRPWAAVAVTVVGVLVVLRPVSSLGWPPAGWALVVCDVGQGDALVLNAGAGAVVVVDAGPDPTLVDRCLDRLEADSVPLVVLSHLHADHAAGLAGVADGRPVGEVETGPAVSPEEQHAAVLGWATARGVPLRHAVWGERRRLGPLVWEVVAPAPPPYAAAPADDPSGAENNASVVLLVTVRGARLLLTGDIEPEAQEALLRTGADLRADVLKVPHHGSRYQQPDLVDAVDPQVAVVSAGADNDYGHPAPETLAMLQRSDVQTYRTDRDGDVAVVVEHGDVRVVTER
jgi:competence protein ComEC